MNGSLSRSRGFVPYGRRSLFKELLSQTTIATGSLAFMVFAGSCLLAAHGKFVIPGDSRPLIVTSIPAQPAGHERLADATPRDAALPDAVTWARTPYLFGQSAPLRAGFQKSATQTATAAPPVTEPPAEAPVQVASLETDAIPLPPIQIFEPRPRRSAADAASDGPEDRRRTSAAAPQPGHRPAAGRDAVSARRRRRPVRQDFRLLGAPLGSGAGLCQSTGRPWAAQRDTDAIAADRQRDRDLRHFRQDRLHARRHAARSPFRPSRNARRPARRPYQDARRNAARRPTTSSCAKSFFTASRRSASRRSTAASMAASAFSPTPICWARTATRTAASRSATTMRSCRRSSERPGRQRLVVVARR